MGDDARHIGRLARYRFPDHVAPESLRPTFGDLVTLDVGIEQKLSRLLVSEDPELADEMQRDDDAVDQLHLRVVRTVPSSSRNGASTHTVDATPASRYHERFADRAVSITRQVLHLAQGTHAPHDRPAVA